MSREDRRRLMDPHLVERIRARLARIKMTQVTRDTQRLEEQWKNLPPNWIESQLLAASKRKEQPHD